jgi:hypothetical protein
MGKKARPRQTALPRLDQDLGPISPRGRAHALDVIRKCKRLGPGTGKAIHLFGQLRVAELEAWLKAGGYGGLGVHTTIR